MDNFNILEERTIEDNDNGFLIKNKKRALRIKEAQKRKKKTFKDKVLGTITERKNIKDNNHYIGIISKSNNTPKINQIEPTKQEQIIKIIEKQEFKELDI